MPEELDVKKILGCDIKNLDKYMVTFSTTVTEPVVTKEKKA